MEQKFNKDWTELECINFLQQKIIKLSIAYYELDYNFVDDYTFDTLCFQLVAMQQSSSVAKDSKYWYMMHDFDGSTGADLYSKLSRRDKEFLTWVVKKEIFLKEHPVKNVVKKKKKKGRLF